MLILLRSDFRLPAREAFLKLMRYAHFKPDNAFEVPVLEAPGASAIVLRLRKMQAERGSVLVMGTSKDESLEESVRVLDAVRNAIPFLAIFPHILLARRTEWRTYSQARQADIECFELPEAKLLVIEQRESYSERTQYHVVAHTMPPTLPKREGKVREGEQTTTEFRLGDAPSATHQRVTDEMLAAAGIEGSIKPDAQERITEMPPPPDNPETKKAR